jgi:hypothetical protein
MKFPGTLSKNETPETLRAGRLAGCVVRTGTLLGSARGVCGSGGLGSIRLSEAASNADNRKSEKREQHSFSGHILPSRA